jgi:hypothetical protein
MRSRLIAQGEPIGNIDGFGKFAPDAGGANSATQIEILVSTAIGFLTITAGLAFLIYFIIGALNWVTAGGDSKKVDDAKHYMTNGAIGMIVIVAAYAITWIVGEVLGIKILEPADTINTITTPIPAP